MENQNISVEELRSRIDGIKSMILSLSVRLEHGIEISIGQYYAKTEKNYRNFSYVFFNNQNQLTFDIKIKMFERFLNRNFPDIIKNDPDFINRLHRVRKLRNKFAHSIRIPEEELKSFLDKSFFELDFIEEGNTKREQFTWNDIKSRLNDLEQLTYRISEIMSRNFKSETGSKIS
jgi:hypothetical protein